MIDQVREPGLGQRLGEGDLDLGRGLLGRDQGGHPAAGDHVDDRDRDPAGQGEVGEVVAPHDVWLPRDPVRPRCPHDRFAGWFPWQDKTFGAQRAQHRGLRDVHDAEAGAAVRELAVRTVDLAPRVGQGHDGFAFGGQQAVHAPARAGIGQCPGLVPLAPTVHPLGVESEQPARLRRRPALGAGVLDQGEQAGLDRCLYAGRDRAGVQSQRAFPSCRCRATACSVIVARSRSFSALSAASSTDSRD